MKIVTLGEILLRLTSPDSYKLLQTNTFDISLAGSEANVAVDLSVLGKKSEFVTVLPNNELGDYVIEELSKHKVITGNILRNDSRLGILYLEVGANQRPSKVIYDRDYSGISQINYDCFNWNQIFQGCCWFHLSGITPALSEEAKELSLIAIRKAQEKNISISIDLNYRSKLWNYGKNANEVLPEFVGYADVLIGNEEDIQIALGVHSNSNDSISNVTVQHYESICEKVHAKFPKLDKIALSLRKSFSANHNNWSSILSDGNSFYYSSEYEIRNIVDRVGAGDSFAAGLIFSLLNNRHPQYCIEFATASSCLKHSIRGDFNLSTLNDIENLIEGNASGRIKR